MQESAISSAVAALRQGGVIAYPTEAVWGLGCDPANQQACVRLLQIKQRPVEKGMILIAGDIEHFSALLTPLPASLWTRVMLGWQQQDSRGAVTYLVPDLMNQVPLWVKGEHPTVALRVSRHPLVRELSQAFGGALVSTSANLAGEPPARSRATVEQELGSQLDLIVQGELGGQQHPSRIIDLVSGEVLRS